MGMHKAQAEPGTRPAHAESRPSPMANVKSWQSYFEDGLRLMGKVAMENPKGRELEKALKEAHRNLAVSVKKAHVARKSLSAWAMSNTPLAAGMLRSGAMKFPTGFIRATPACA